MYKTNNVEIQMYAKWNRMVKREITEDEDDENETQKKKYEQLNLKSLKNDKEFQKRSRQLKNMNQWKEENMKHITQT